LSSHPLLTAPIGPALWRLAGPTTALMVVQIFVAIAETWIVGRLGTDSLAGFVLVVPFMALMFNMANGGMGGAVASALARALGAGRHDDARVLLLHALLVGWGLALVFMALGWTALPPLFRLMGGSGRALAEALAFSNWFFAAALLVWPSCFLAALLRGAGDSATPSRIGAATSVVYVALSFVLAPRLGLVGLVIAGATGTTISLALMTRAVRRGRLGFIPAVAGVRLQPRLFGEILRVGLMGSASTPAAILTAVLVTGLVGRFGTAALAGYGIGMRLEFMLAPLAFGIGTGLTTLVGLAARQSGCVGRRSVGLHHHRQPRLDRGAGAGELGAAVHLRCRGRGGKRRLPQPRGAGLLLLRLGPHALLRKPGCRPHGGTLQRQHRAHDRGDGRRLVRDREDGPRPRWRVPRHRRRAHGLRLPDRGVAAGAAVARPVTPPTCYVQQLVCSAA
jgi:hypothetical protein